MKFKLIVFSCLYFIGNDIFVATNGYLPPGLKETRLKQYPFMALLPGWRCSAVLITQQHLVIPRVCIESKTTTTTVDFDFEYLPPHYNINTQNYTISRIITDEHEEGEDGGIAVVELERPVTFSDTIRPAKLISEKDFELFESNATGQMIGLWKGYTSALSVETVKLEVRSECISIFGGALKDQEKLCAATSTNNGYLPFYGNAMTFRNKVAGLLVKNDYCSPSAPNCTRTFLNMVPFLKWISEKVNVSEEELTGNDENISEDQKKIEDTRQNLQSMTYSFSGVSQGTRSLPLGFWTLPLWFWGLGLFFRDF